MAVFLYSTNTPEVKLNTKGRGFYSQSSPNTCRLEGGGEIWRHDIHTDYWQTEPKYSASLSTAPFLKYRHFNVNYIWLIQILDERQFVFMRRRYPSEYGHFRKSSLSLKEMQLYVECICRFWVNQKQNIEDE